MLAKKSSKTSPSNLNSTFKNLSTGACLKIKFIFPNLMVQNSEHDFAIKMTII